MSQESLVSVCLPTYNGAKFIEAALASVLNQTYRNFEVIVIDDRSKDDTVAIVERIAQHEPRIKLFKNPINLGLFENYNECMRRASGAYIKLFAQDDIFKPTVLAKMVAVLEAEPNIALVSCAKQWLDAHGNIVEPTTVNEKKITGRFESDTRLEGRIAIRESLRDLVNWLGEPCTIMFRRSKTAPGFDTRFKQIGDLDIAYRLLQDGDYYFISEPLCSFRKHEGSTTLKNSLSLVALLDWLVLAGKYKEVIPETGESEDQFAQRFTKRFMHAIATKFYSTVDGKAITDDDTSALEHLTEHPTILAAFEGAPGGERNLLNEFRAFAVSCLREGARMHNDHRYLKQVIRIQRETILAERIEHGEQIESLQDEIAELKLALSELGNSLSWKVTAPLRNARRFMK